MEDANNASHGQPKPELGQTSSQPVITGALGNPQFHYRTPGNEERTPNSNVPFNLAQLSQFSPVQLQTVASFIQMLTGNPQQNTPPQQSGGTRKRPLATAGRNADGTPLRKMQSLGKEGREMERKIDRSDYEEEILETEELYHSKEETRVTPKLSPFTSEILNHPMMRIKMPSSKYDGTSDPDDHVAAYEGYMFLYTQVDVILCKVFPSTLTGIAQTWFKSLKPGSISSFSQLSSMFSTHFVSNRRRERTTGELLPIKQGVNECLRDYISRFNVEAVSIPRLQQDVTVLVLMTKLKEGSPFRNYLGRKSYTSLGPVLGKANDYIRGEEFDKAISSRESEKKEDKQKKEKGREVDRGRDERKQESNWSKEEMIGKGKTRSMTAIAEIVKKAAERGVNARKDLIRTLNLPPQEARFF
ncbi:uncharacterized protein LOC125494811 [Beta vulgaris subsp. vulgaris]|uniref:uncharacterized protein LOC125494811 n=1 Tax=Beta vulgaris subsp. vulgaris TaxID=3555 RepID=UPI0020371185|nr:uncharacterized protein LOC125494811 [Beta vulgaris subsp. vulgaris]